MNIKNKLLHPSLYLLFYICISAITGCSIGINTPDDPNAFYKSQKLYDFSSQNPRISFTKISETGLTFTINNDIEILSKENISTLSYNNLYYDTLNMIAVNNQEYNDNKYKFLIDTGFNYLAMTNSITVEENGLSILPAGPIMGNDIYGGYCFLPDFNFGFTSIDWMPCIFIQQHWEFNLLGIPIWQQKGFLLGNQFLSKYSYLYFDNPARKLTFSANQVFTPSSELNWVKYPLYLAKDRHLFITIPIASKNLDVMFDTCGSHGIVLEHDKWQQIKSNIEIINEKDSTFISGFYGKLSCNKIKVKELQIADKAISRPEIIVQGNNDQETLQSYISMKYFRNDHIVLDYKNQLIWVGHK